MLVGAIKSLYQAYRFCRTYCATGKLLVKYCLTAFQEA